jgi:hypothetical protein
VTQYLDDSDSISSVASSAIEAECGGIDRATLIRFAHESPLPVTALGRLAPHLTRAGEDGEPWAVETVHVEELRLSRLTRRHLKKHHPKISEPIVSLSGSVWRSRLVRDEFDSGLGLRTRSVELSTVDGAVRAARALMEGRSA